MIVRISGTGQFDLADQEVRRLNDLDDELTKALHDRDEATFRRVLSEIVTMVTERGTPVGDDQVVPSDVIVPPEDITLDEAGRFFTDEGLMQPLPA